MIQVNTGFVVLLLGIVYLLSPVFYTTYFNSEDSNVGGSTSAILLLVALSIFFYRVINLKSKPTVSSNYIAIIILLIGLSVFFLGQVLVLPLLSIGSIVFLLSAIVLLHFGSESFKSVLFPLFLMLFVLPLPYMMTDFVVQPMKLFVSAVSESILYYLDYPISRNGVVLTLGGYQLLVADACSGVNSLFSLEAIGLLYVQIIHRGSSLRNSIIAFFIIPISLISNVTRILILALLTYYYGNDVGQGFLHEFSGMLLFIIALVLISFLDNFILKILPARYGKKYVD